MLHGYVFGVKANLTNFSLVWRPLLSPYFCLCLFPWSFHSLLVCEWVFLLRPTLSVFLPQMARNAETDWAQAWGAFTDVCQCLQSVFFIHLKITVNICKKTHTKLFKDFSMNECLIQTTQNHTQTLKSSQLKKTQCLPLCAKIERPLSPYWTRSKSVSKLAAV